MPLNLCQLLSPMIIGHQSFIREDILGLSEKAAEKLIIIAVYPSQLQLIWTVLLKIPINNPGRLADDGVYRLLVEHHQAS
jgi:hypothetical protein